MATLPGGKEVLRNQGCTAEQFDEVFLQGTRGEGARHGYFHYPHGELQRYLLVLDGEPLMAAWDDGNGGGATLMKDFFEPFLRQPRDIGYREVKADLVEAMATTWFRKPQAYISQAILPPDFLFDSLLQTGREATVRIRRPPELSFAIIGAGEVRAYYPAIGEAAVVSNAVLRAELERQPAALALDVFGKPEPVRSEDWALMPNNFHEGMVRFYCHTAPHIILSLGGREVQRLPLKSGRTTIGRDPLNDMMIDNLSVSRRHSVVSFFDGVCMIEDNGSSNGTIVNDERISKPTRLDDGMEAVIGKHAVRYVARALRTDVGHVASAEIDQTVYLRAQPVEPESSERVAVLTVGGQSIEVRHTPYVIGSSEKSSLRLEGQGVKPRHAELIGRPDGGYEITHVGGMMSTTRINGKKIKTATLQSGDLLQIGAVLLRFHLRAPSNRIT